MTLSIGVFRRNPNTGDMDWVKLAAGKDLFGFEVYRYKLWGADIMVSLGLTIHPTLKNGAWLVLEGDDLDEVKNEGQIVPENLSLIAQETPLDEETIRFRAQNLIDAIKLAKEIGGGVSIG
jgi:hypothetical protein